jgi:hypothetical protein
MFAAAEAKFFLAASAEERARRRVAELAAAGATVDYAETLREIAERDQRDASRDAAPMVPAADAGLVDSSTQTLEEVVESLARVADAGGEPPARGQKNDQQRCSVLACRLGSIGRMSPPWLTKRVVEGTNSPLHLGVATAAIPAWVASGDPLE